MSILPLSVIPGAWVHEIQLQFVPLIEAPTTGGRSTAVAINYHQTTASTSVHAQGGLSHTALA